MRIISERMVVEADGEDVMKGKRAVEESVEDRNNPNLRKRNSKGD